MTKQTYINVDKESLLNQDQVKDLFDYDPVTGSLYWKNPTGDSYRGTKAGFRQSSGGLAVFVNGYVYQVSRIIWLYHHGEWPSNAMSHKDGDSMNARIENLEVTDRIGRHGCVGVTKNREKWVVRRRFAGAQIYAGKYKELDDAVAVAELMNEKFGQYTRSPTAEEITAFRDEIRDLIS